MTAGTPALLPGTPVRYVGPRHRIIGTGNEAYVVAADGRGVTIGHRGFRIHVSTDDLQVSPPSPGLPRAPTP